MNNYLGKKLGAMLLPPKEYSRTSYYIDLFVYGKKDTTKLDSYEEMINEFNGVVSMVKNDSRYRGVSFKIVAYTKDFNKANRCLKTNIVKIFEV